MGWKGLLAFFFAVFAPLVIAQGAPVGAQAVANITLPSPGTTKQLYDGCNNISLTFPDGTSSQAVLQAVTPAGVVESMWRHDAQDKRFYGFSPAAPGASDLLSVDFLDSVWLCVRAGGAPAPTATPAPSPQATATPTPTRTATAGPTATPNDCVASVQAKIVEVTDGLGHTNPNSWAEDGTGDWPGGLDAAPVVMVGTTINVHVTAAGECPIQYQFQRDRPSGGTFEVLRPWSSSPDFTYTFVEEDYGMWTYIIPQIRDSDPRMRFGNTDDYNYLSYVVE